MEVVESALAKNEVIFLKAIEAGELEIDKQGQIWRVAARRWDRWRSRTRLHFCRRHRAEKRQGDRLVVRMKVDSETYHIEACRLVWLFIAKCPIPSGATIRHRNDDKSDNHPMNLLLIRRGAFPGTHLPPLSLEAFVPRETENVFPVEKGAEL